MEPNGSARWTLRRRKRSPEAINPNIPATFEPATEAEDSARVGALIDTTDLSGGDSWKAGGSEPLESRPRMGELGMELNWRVRVWFDIQLMCTNALGTRWAQHRTRVHSRMRRPHHCTSAASLVSLELVVA